jgi:hypothetical protein
VTRSVTRIVSDVPLCLSLADTPLRRLSLLGRGLVPRDGVLRVDTRRSQLAGVGLLRAFEHGVVTDSAPPAAEISVDGDELEGGAAVGAGE